MSADARETYAAIRYAKPGGLGEARAHDVGGEPDVTLLEAMEAAEGRDRIAWNYTHDFTDIFDLGLPRFKQAMAESDSLPLAATSVYLSFLATIPDTLIARKFGMAQALEVQQEAKAVEARLDNRADEQARESRPHGLRSVVEGARPQSRNERRSYRRHAVRSFTASLRNRLLKAALRRTIDLPILRAPDYLLPA